MRRDFKALGLLSLSARRAWIEISNHQSVNYSLAVALRKESVDRNIPSIGTLRSTHVALRKESVDRNVLTLSCMIGPPSSLSARRAWIEM